MGVFIEGLRSLGDMPGHLFRETRRRQYDRPSTVRGVANRVRVFEHIAPRTFVESQVDAVSRSEHVAGRISKLKHQDLESRRQMVDFESELISTRGGAIIELRPFVSHVSIGQDVITIATSADLKARQEEQIERVRRMIEIGKRLTPQWMTYTLKVAPELLVSDQLQKSS